MKIYKLIYKKKKNKKEKYKIIDHEGHLKFRNQRIIKMLNILPNNKYSQKPPNMGQFIFALHPTGNFYQNR